MSTEHAYLAKCHCLLAQPGAQVWVAAVNQVPPEGHVQELRGADCTTGGDENLEHIQSADGRSKRFGLNHLEAPAPFL